MTRTRIGVAAGLTIVCWLWTAPVLAQSRAERVELTTADDLKLTAYWYVPADADADQAPAVVLIHNPGSSQAAWQPMVLRLLGSGFRVLTFDLRGHGESKETTEDVYERIRRRDPGPYYEMVQDVEAAVRWLTETPKLSPDRIAVMGGAYGANLAMQAGARNKKLAAVIAVSPSKLFFSDPLVEHARKYGNRPLFIIITKQFLSQGATEIQELNKDNETFALKVFPRYEPLGTQLLGLSWDIEARAISWLKAILEMPSS